MLPDVPTRGSLRDASYNAIFFGVAFASADALLVQWTSGAATVALLLFGGSATFLLFCVFSEGVAVLRALLRHVRRLAPEVDSSLPVLLACVILYPAGRLRVAGSLPVSLPVLAVSLILVVGLLCVFVPSAETTNEPRGKVWTLPLLHILSVCWIVLAPLGSRVTAMSIVLVTLAAVVNL